jgi:hypothetical protein
MFRPAKRAPRFEKLNYYHPANTRRLAPRQGLIGKPVGTRRRFRLRSILSWQALSLMTCRACKSAQLPNTTA